MKSFFRKQIIALALALAASVTACGFAAFATQNEQNEEPDPQSETELEPEPEPDPEPISIESGKITLKYASYTFADKPVTPDARELSDGSVVNELTLKVDGKKLTKDVDYTLSYKNNTKPGTATVTATGIGDYTGSVSRDFAVKPKTIAITTLETGNGIVVNWDKDASADGYQVLYSTDRDFVTYHSTTVTDINKTYVNLTNVPRPGEKYYIKMRAFVEVGGKRYGNYSSLRSKTVKWTLKKITIPSLEYTYVARALVPSVKVWNKEGTKLVEGTDYTCKITNATNVGTATITVKGKGNYTGTLTKNFKVIKADISKASLKGVDSAYSYTGKAVKPTPALTYKTKTLKNGTDYTVSYKSNVEIGTATITIKGKGNFSGSRTKTFKIDRTGWETENGWKVYYYIGKKATGKFDIGSDTYYFDSKGIMQTGWQKIGDYYYCFDRLNGKLVKGTTINKIKVDSTGKAVDLTTYGKQRIATMMHAHQIVLEQTKPTDTMAEKRLKVFKWEYSTHPYKQWRLINNVYRQSDEWDILFANDIFVRGSGCCVADACAAAFLFLEIGYTDIWACHDTGHGWMTMGGRLYDPLFAEARDFNANYNAVGSDYRINPPFKIRID
ncbi:MAG: hypothetical protein IJ746_00330 [Ruminococcus sp.]|nr:hypothetical protein [Ruminococcus sp.]